MTSGGDNVLKESQFELSIGDVQSLVIRAQAICRGWIVRHRLLQTRQEFEDICTQLQMTGSVLWKHQHRLCLPSFIGDKPPQTDPFQYLSKTVSRKSRHTSTDIRKGNQIVCLNRVLLVSFGLNLVFFVKAMNHLQPCPNHHQFFQ